MELFQSSIVRISQQYLEHFQIFSSLQVHFFTILGVRCLETGITEVCLLVDKDSMEKEKMKTFVQEVRNTGLILKEPDQFKPNNPFQGILATQYKNRIKPWEIVDE